MSPDQRDYCISFFNDTPGQFCYPTVGSILQQNWQVWEKLSASLWVVSVLKNKVYPTEKRMQAIQIMGQRFLREDQNSVHAWCPWTSLLGLLSSTEKLVPLRRLHMRELQNCLKPSGVRKNRICQMGKNDPSSKISSAVVDAGQPSQNRFSSTLPSSTVPGFLGCFHGGMGCPYGHEPNLGKMDRRTVQVSHKPAGIDCSTFSSAPMGENTQKQCSVGSRVVCYSQQARGTVSRTMCLEVTHLWAHKRNIRLIARHIPGKPNVLADSLSRDGQILPNEWSPSPTIF